MYRAILIIPILFVSLSGNIQAQVPQAAPLDSEFTEYLGLKAKGLWRNVSDDGHPLGLIPVPHRHRKDVPHRMFEKAVVLPSVYDLRTQGKMSSVKDQGNCGSCWSFATMGSIESRWISLGIGEKDLSENNLKDCHGFEWAPCAGGNEEISTSCLSKRSAPMSESDDPYVDASAPCVTGLTPMSYVDQAWYLPTDSTVIKTMIYTYGALYTTMYYTGASYNSTTKTYYYSGKKATNHGVTLAGWDDGKVVPGAPHNGAWIIKNSWGPSWGESGYFYVSYYDSKINLGVAIWPHRIDYNSLANLYFYDEFGGVSSAGYNDPSGISYGLMKFLASNGNPVTKIGTWIPNSNTTVDIWIYDAFDGTTLSNLLGTISGQVCTYAGYYTFDLPTPVNMSPGNDFYVKVKYYSPGAGYPIPIEVAIVGYCTPTIETGRCWLSLTGSSWTKIGTGTFYPWDLCIRAYASPTLVASIKVFLQGPYSGSSMGTALNTGGLIPLTQPYSGAPWNYSGTENVTSIPSGVVDWVLVELRTGTGSLTSVGTRAAFLKSDGTVAELDGTSPVGFSVLPGNYYVIMRHRNHIAVMSANSVDFTSGSASHDFTTAQSQAYGTDPMKDLGSGKFGIYAGDASGNGQVQNDDKNDYWQTQVGTAGYKSADFNLSGQVQNDDKNDHWQLNVGLGTQVPP
jgi:C1A family cysteine protease